MGGWNWQLVTAGRFRLDGGSMFGVVPQVLWRKLVTPDQRNRVPLACHCVLLERDGTRVLIECGYGDKFTDKERDIFALEDTTLCSALAEHAIPSESIAAVLLSHLHFDHAAGISRINSGGDLVSALPGADIYVQRQEWEDARSGRSTMSKTYLQSTLDPIVDQVKLIAGEAVVLDDIRLRPRPGHTWGQQSIEFDDAEGTICFPADVMPTRHHVGSAYSMGYDMLPWDNMQTKAALLSEACESDWRLILYHEPERPICRVTRDSQHGFQLIDA